MSPITHGQMREWSLLFGVPLLPWEAEILDRADLELRTEIMSSHEEKDGSRGA